MDEYENLTALVGMLREWEHQRGGNPRVELRLVCKHTGELGVEGGAGPLGELVFELDEALKALAFVQYLKRLGRDIVQP